MLGQSLPEEYKGFLVEVNGGYPQDSACMFLLRTGYDELITLHGIGLHDSDLEIRATGLRAAWIPDDVIAIGSAGGGIICLGMKTPHVGEIWYADTAGADGETFEMAAKAIELESDPAYVKDESWFVQRDVLKLADSLFEFLSRLQPRGVEPPIVPDRKPYQW